MLWSGQEPEADVDVENPRFEGRLSLRVGKGDISVIIIKSTILMRMPVP